MIKITGIDHICVAVKSLEKARSVYEGDLLLKPLACYVSEQEGVRVVRYKIGEVALELMEPLRENTEVAKFLANRGEGVYLIAYRVSDVLEALQWLKIRGVKLIDEHPRYLMGNRYAFIHHPRDLCGVLSEVVDGDFVFSCFEEKESGK